MLANLMKIIGIKNTLIGSIRFKCSKKLMKNYIFVFSVLFVVQ